MFALENVWKAYPMRQGMRNVLKGINFTVHRGDAIGILGRNGAGKSTLLRLIAGVEYPTHGRVRREMNISWPLAAGFGVQASLTGADNVRFIARVYDKPIQRTVDYVKDFSELGPYFNMPVRTYSSGMHGRLLFAISLAIDFDCYLIDETTSAGDARFHERCKAALAEKLSRGSLLMVSHHTSHIQEYCRTAAVLEDGILTHYEDLDEAIRTYQSL